MHMLCTSGMTGIHQHTHQNFCKSHCNFSKFALAYTNSYNFTKKKKCGKVDTSESCTSLLLCLLGECALCHYEVRSSRGEASSTETGLESAFQFSQRAYISEYFRKHNAFTCTLSSAPASEVFLYSLQVLLLAVFTGSADYRICLV